MKALDEALQSFQVQRQAYYSGTFVGNHVHSSLKVCLKFFTITSITSTQSPQAKNINTLCHSMVKLAQAHCPSLIPDTTALCKKFKELFELFANCHHIYDQNYVTDDEITKLGKCS